MTHDPLRPHHRPLGSRPRRRLRRAARLVVWREVRTVIPHVQTIRAGRPDGHSAEGLPGNCLQTAVASLFDLDPADVPHFALYVDWFSAMRRWARTRSADFSYFPVPVPDEHAESWEVFRRWLRAVPQYALADGPSPRGPFFHVVIVDADLELAHDPHPSAAGLVEVRGVYCYSEPYDPPPPMLALTAGGES